MRHRLCAESRQRDYDKAKNTTTWRPAMVARLIAPDNSRGVLHLTFLTIDGQKAATTKVKRFPAYIAIPPGGAVRLTPLGESADELGVAEGIETAVSAGELHGVPTWATLTTTGLMKFEPPPGLGKLIIFGDADMNFAGHPAYSLAHRLRMARPMLKVVVKLPDEAEGSDWNDVAKLRRAIATSDNVVPLR